MTEQESKTVHLVRDYYTRKLRQHGATPQGVDWRDPESQALRFDVLIGLLDEHQEATVTDLGCGYGALLDHMAIREKNFRYVGVDVSPEMIATAVEVHQTCSCVHPDYSFRVGHDVEEPSEFAVASGILNVKMSVSESVWRDHVWQTVRSLASNTTVGFAYNCLSDSADPDRRRDDLHYGKADEHRLFVEGLGWHAEVLQEYGLWEFTILARR